MATGLTLKELSKKEDLFTHGHRMCAGCGAPIVVKMVLMATEYPVVAANAKSLPPVGTRVRLLFQLP